MAADNYKKHFHLTPRGWISGSRWFFDNPQVELGRPADAIATFELHIYQRSQWSAENRSWAKIWQADDATDAKVAALAEQFEQPNEDSRLPEA